MKTTSISSNSNANQVYLSKQSAQGFWFTVIFIAATVAAALIFGK